MDYSYSYSANGAAAVAWFLLMIAFYALVVVGLWKTFVKAGHPGWAAIVPFYNLYIWIKMSGRPTSWFWIMLVCSLLAWIPILGILLVIAVWVMSLMIALDNSKNFGQGTGFGILLWLFPFVMYLVLGFGSMQYRQVAHPEAGGWSGSGGGGAAPPPPPSQYTPPTPPPSQYTPPTTPPASGPTPPESPTSPPPPPPLQ